MDTPGHGRDDSVESGRVEPAMNLLKGASLHVSRVDLRIPRLKQSIAAFYGTPYVHPLNPQSSVDTMSRHWRTKSRRRSMG
jgi:hypothetical protein